MTLTRASKAGSSTALRTSACAARWKTASGRERRRLARDGGAVGDVAADEPGAGAECPGEVLLPAGREVVEHQHLVPATDERIDEVGADEAGPAGDEAPHRRRVCARSCKAGGTLHPPAAATGSVIMAGRALPGGQSAVRPDDGGLRAPAAEPRHEDLRPAARGGARRALDVVGARRRRLLRDGDAARLAAPAGGRRHRPRLRPDPARPPRPPRPRHPRPHRPGGVERDLDDLEPGPRPGAGERAAGVHLRRRLRGGPAAGDDAAAPSRPRPRAAARRGRGRRRGHDRADPARRCRRPPRRRRGDALVPVRLPQRERRVLRRRRPRLPGDARPPAQRAAAARRRRRPRRGLPLAGGDQPVARVPARPRVRGARSRHGHPAAGPGAARRGRSSASRSRSSSSNCSVPTTPRPTPSPSCRSCRALRSQRWRRHAPPPCSARSGRSSSAAPTAGRGCACRRGGWDSR